MSKRSSRLKLNNLPRDTKAALVAKILENTNSFHGIAEWLFSEYGIKTSTSAVWRFAKTIQTKYSGLLDLGMNIEAIADHLNKLETLGAFLVQREILNERIAGLLAEVMTKPLNTHGDV